MMEVVLYGNAFAGWEPIHTLAALVARLLEGRTVILPSPPRPSRATQLVCTARSRLPRRGNGPATVYIARHPTEIASLACEPWFPRSGGAQAVWIIDSLWTERMPHPLFRPRFDVVAFTQGYDRDAYEAMVGDRAIHLGWGTDALDLGSAGADRSLDLLRIGRQPAGWADDARTADAARRYGLRFHGRPPSADTQDPLLRQAALLRDWITRTKLVLAHTNRLGGADNIHPTKEFYTARWTDALGCGASVAGRAPRSGKLQRTTSRLGAAKACTVGPSARTRVGASSSSAQKGRSTWWQAMSASCSYSSSAGYVLPLQTKQVSSHCFVMRLSWPNRCSFGSSPASLNFV